MVYFSGFGGLFYVVFGWPMPILFPDGQLFWRVQMAYFILFSGVLAPFLVFKFDYFSDFYLLAPCFPSVL